jgi:large subunit ribosomal protein L22
MIAQAKAKYIRVSPTKVKSVIDLIRGKNVLEALALLNYAQKGCRDKVIKALKSAIHNAKEKGLLEEQLIVSKVTADKGPMWKRWRPAAFGRATPILKKTTHLTVELDLKTK